MRLRRVSAVFMCAAALTLAACGEDDNDTNTASGGSSKDPAMTTPPTAPGAGNTTTTPPPADTTSRLGPVNLQKADFPAEWTETNNEISPAGERVQKELLKCAGINREWNPVRSKEFQRGIAELSATSSVVEAPSADVAAEDFRGFGSTQFRDCANTLLQTELKTQLGTQGTVQSQSFEKVPFPTAGDELIPYRFQATVMASGQTLQSDVLYTFMRVGAVEVNLQFAGLNMAFPQDLATQLATKVADRAKMGA